MLCQTQHPQELSVWSQDECCYFPQISIGICITALTLIVILLMRNIRGTVKKFVDTPNCARIFWMALNHFIFRKSCFHSLNKGNIKKISAVVPEITELEHTWRSLSGPRDF